MGFIMAKNTGNNTRKGAVKDRSQYFNEKTNTFLKRGPDGKFMSGKSTPYKGIRTEKSVETENLKIKSNNN